MKKTSSKHGTAGIKPVIAVALLTALVTLGVVYFTGFPTHSPRDGHNHPEVEAEKTLYTCSMHPFIVTEEPGDCPVCGMELVPKKNEDAPRQNTERKIVYWKAPMNPAEIYDKPGKSAMGMDLVPVYADEVSGGVDIKIDPTVRQNMGIRTAPAVKGPLVHTIRTYGHLTYDETRTAQISPRYSGWIEKQYVNFTGQIVEKGRPLFTVYSPELVSAQEEYLEAYRNAGNSNRGYPERILASVRRRLDNYGLSAGDIRALEQRNRAQNTLTIRSPVTGVVTSKSLVEGGFFKAGATIYTLSDLSTIWVEAHIYEYELSLIKEGMEASMTLPYEPGSHYTGKVAYIYPYMQQKTRDVVVRLEFENPDLALKPEMYANVRIKTLGNEEGTIIPSQSVLRSGEQNIVFVRTGEGTFSPRNVTPGIELDGGNIQILEGIAPGETVVTSGQFLLDSESKLKEAVHKMLEADKAEEGDAPPKDTEEDDFFNDF